MLLNHSVVIAACVLISKELTSQSAVLPPSCCKVKHKLMFRYSGPKLFMAGRLALRSAEPTAFRVFLGSTTASLNLKRNAGGNATPLGSIKTEADLTEITLPTILYRMIFKGYHNRMHELQVQYVK